MLVLGAHYLWEEVVSEVGLCRALTYVYAFASPEYNNVLIENFGAADLVKMKNVSE